MSAKYTPSRTELSFDGCGINGPDEYRTRICTFAEKRGEIANHYGPIFANASELLDALRRLVHPMASDDDVDHALAVLEKVELRK